MEFRPGSKAVPLFVQSVAAFSAAALAEEVAKDGALVNAVAPSIMDTAANRDAKS
jgi:NAD(P)-dependent dehydrogenase (short-subunit alcohol dehydrogenase family)